jgi:hypothetical protein
MPESLFQVFEIVNSAESRREKYTSLLLPDWKSRGVTEWKRRRVCATPCISRQAMVRAGDA